MQPQKGRQYWRNSLLSRVSVILLIDLDCKAEFQNFPDPETLAESSPVRNYN